jgi:hypothetical protein
MPGMEYVYDPKSGTVRQVRYWWETVGETWPIVAAVAFVAIGVWLTVRIVNRRERWAKWTLAAVASLPVLYVLSYGPMSWWLYNAKPRSGTPWQTHIAFYYPLQRIEISGPHWASEGLQWYRDWGRHSEQRNRRVLRLADGAP